LEAEFREIRKIMHCRRELAFYSVQRLILEREARKRVLAQLDARKTFECEVLRCERRVLRVQSDLETAKEALASVPAPTQAPAPTGEVLQGKAYVVKSWVHLSAPRIQWDELGRTSTRLHANIWHVANESSLRAAMRDKAKAEERWQSAPPYLLVAMFALGASPA
jgi:hypothetical protein